MTADPRRVIVTVWTDTDDARSFVEEAAAGSDVTTDELVARAQRKAAEWISDHETTPNGP